MYVTYIVYFLNYALTLYIIPQYDSSSATCVSSLQTAPWSSSPTVTFLTTFTVKPQVVISWKKMDIQFNDYGFTSEVISVTLNDFTLQCSVLRGSVWKLDVDWIAFVDDNVYALSGKYPSSTIPNQITIPFPSTLSYSPSGAFFPNGILLQQIGVISTTGFESSMNSLHPWGAIVNIVPQPGFAITYLSYSIIYGHQNHLRAGQLIIVNNFMLSLILAPLPQFSVGAMGILSGYCVLGTNLRLQNTYSGNFAQTGYIHVGPWGNTILYAYNGGCYQYAPCPTYCTSCSAVMVCQSCAVNSFRVSTNCAQCLPSYFYVSGQVACVSCASYCLNCSGTSSDCSACLISTSRLNPPNCQICPSNMFVQAGVDNCQLCNSHCNNCITTSTNCIACKGLYKINAPNCDQCSMPNYYNDASYNDCQVCSSYCDGCINSATSCLRCWPFTFKQITNACPECPQSQFTLYPPMCNANYQLTLCSTDYNRGPSCNCLPGYFNDENSLKCLKCVQICTTCTDSATNCTQCNSQLLTVLSKCQQCINGYFMLYDTCTICSTDCATCTRQSGACLVCSQPRINPPTCHCPNGYFNNCTQTCSFQCFTCKSGFNNCLTCAGNRINPPLCGCPDGSIQQSAFCSSNYKYKIDCTSAAPSAKFSDDLNSIIIAFQYSLRQGPQCQDILSQQTLQQMGANCQCTINQNIIQVTLGTNATINVNSPIFFTANLYFGYCDQALTNIVTPLIQEPNQFNAPLITFNSLVFTTTQCDDVYIDVISMAFNGQRSLQLINWKVIEGHNLTPLIKQWNSNSNVQNSYNISSQNLQGSKTIQLLITYQNFIGSQGSEYITIYIKSKVLQLNLQVSTYLQVFDQAQIIFQPIIYQCGSNILNEQIQVSVHIINETTKLIYNYTMTSELQQTILLEPFQLSLNSNYNVVAQATTNAVGVQIEKSFSVIPMNFIVNINGGDQQIGLNQILNLRAQIFDPNSQNSLILNQKQYNYSWFCKNIIIGEDCPNFQYNQNFASLNSSNLEPFTTLQISVIVQQYSLSANSIIIVKCLENQINQITMNGNQYQLNLPLNRYDLVDVSIQYQDSIKFDVDNLTYYAQYLDQNYDLKKIQFSYINTTIDMSIFELNSNIKFQTIIANPLQGSPSVATLNLRLNIPPQQCQIKVTSRGQKYSINILSCVSSQQPLSYQFIYYQSKENLIFDNNNGRILKGIILTDFQTSSRIDTYLFKSNSSLILCRIKDSLNGLSNVSLSLQSVQNTNFDIFEVILTENNINLQRNVYLFLQNHLINNQSIPSNSFQSLIKLFSQFNQLNYITWLIQQQLSNYQIISHTEIESQLVLANDEINKISQQIQSLQNDFNQGKYIKDYGIKLLYLKDQTIGSASYVAFLYAQSQVSDNRRLLVDSVNNVTDQLVQATSVITSILGNLTKVNQNKEAINTTQFNLTAQGFTTATINQNFGIQILNIPNQTAQYKNQVFKVNPYQNQSDFVNAVQAPLIVPNLIDANQVEIKPANPLAFAFPIVGAVEVSCASQIAGSWSLDVCKVVKSEIVQCLCSTLSPLSIVQALEYILSQFKGLFERTIIGKINSFPYGQVLYTYIIAIFVIVYVLFNILLLRRDDAENVRVFPVVLKVVFQQENEHIQRGRIDSKGSIQLEELLYTESSLIGVIKMDQLTKYKGFIEFFKISHIILEIFFRYDSKDPRILRLSLLFLQILGQICIFVLFGKNLAISLVIALSIFQTAYGIVFQLILSRMIKSKNKYVQTAGITIASLLTGLCTYLIIAAIALYSDVHDANIAALSYLASFILDYFISNFFVELGKYAFILKTVNSKKYKKIYEIIIPTGLQEVVFGKLLTQPQTLSDIK